MRNYLQLSNNGAWCWFQDPRAVFIDGEYKKTYAQWLTTREELQVGSYNHKSKKINIYTIKSNWGYDDHNVGSFLVLPDNRLMIFYARHNKRGIYSRITKNSEDITSWEEESTITNQKRITYSHPVFLREEHKYLVFFRGKTWKPTFCESENGKDWSKPKVLIQDKERTKRTIRPYTKVFSNNLNSIHFVYTDGHPRKQKHNSVYYLKYQDQKFQRSGGETIAEGWEGQISPDSCDLVYDGSRGKGRGWVWDLTEDKKGNPCVLYTRLPSKKDHKYCRAKWDGNTWKKEKICDGGKWFPQTKRFRREKEPHYSGGMCFLPGNPDIVYLSREQDRGFVIEKSKRTRQGWESTVLSNRETSLNVRPVVPRGWNLHKNKNDHVLWMSGRYRHYTDYNTSINMVLGVPSPKKGS